MTKRTTPEPASLAEPSLVPPPLAALAKQLSEARAQLTVAREQEFLLSEQLLRMIAQASGATVSADAFKEEPVSPNAPARLSIHCTCSRDSDASYEHHHTCRLWRSLPERSGATAEAVSIAATVIHPPGTRRGGGSGSGATEGNVSQKRASADALRSIIPTTCDASFCLKGWRGEANCTSYCTEERKDRGTTAAEGATGGQLHLVCECQKCKKARECSTSKAGAHLSDNKPPVVINITPAHLSDDDKITLYQLKARADAAYARDQITHGRDGYNL